VFIDVIANDHAMKALAETGKAPISRTAELAPTPPTRADVYAAFQDVLDAGLFPILEPAYRPRIAGECGQGRSARRIADGPRGWDSGSRGFPNGAGGARRH
jgi:hypothetical protein